MAKASTEPLYKKSIYRAGIILILVSISAAIYKSPSADALYIQNRSVTISTSIPSATSDETFRFTYPSTDDVGSIVFQYCDNAALISLPCTAPPGMDVSGAVLTGQTGNTGFSIYGAGTNANMVTLTRPAAAGLIVPSTYDFTSVTNPSDSNHTVYVRISLYTSTDGSGAFNDNGAVAFATTVALSVNVQVPPFMKICVGITVTANCSSATGSRLNLGTLVTSATKYGTSQMAIGTNSATGFVTYILGTTMTSGNNTIPAVHPAAGSQTGISQFGLNLRANTSPAIGQEPSGGTGTPQAGYDTPNQFNLKSGDIIATSPLPTDFSRLTVSYIANINTVQLPGIYTTTFTYLSVAEF